MMQSEYFKIDKGDVVELKCLQLVFYKMIFSNGEIAHVK